jgi:putative transposase
MTRYIDAHKGQYGVEPICRVLEIAPSTYYAAGGRPACARRVQDERLKPEVARVHAENYGVYGARKVWRQLNREGFGVGRDRVWRLMRNLQLAGIRRGKAKRTTFPGEVAERPQDLVDRVFMAVAPNRLWVADLTYVSTWSGFVYVAFVVDAFSRRIVGWRVSASLHAELALDALEMAIWSRRAEDLSSLVHHSAAKVGKCWGLGSNTTKDPGPWEGEQRNMWKPTQQEALWFHGGNLHQSRHYSLYLALQLKARMEGIQTPIYGLQEVHHLS